MTVPPCQMWTDIDEVLDRRRGVLTRIKVYVDESHVGRALRRCSCCGRLYFWDWIEEIDWEDGNDPTWETWVPVTGEADVAPLLAMPPGLVLVEPRLLNDHPKGGPRRRRWIGDPSVPFQATEGT